MLHYFTLNTAVEIICFFIAIFCLIKDANLAWRSMILFLFITCIVEMIGIYIKRLNLTDSTHVHSNAWIYNVLIFFQAAFFSLMFQYLLNKYIKKYIFIAGFTLVIILHVYEIFHHGILIYDGLTNIVMSVLLVLYSFYFYYCLIKDN